MLRLIIAFKHQVIEDYNVQYIETSVAECIYMRIFTIRDNGSAYNKINNSAIFTDPLCTIYQTAAK